MTSLFSQLYTYGQSLWYDNIERRLLEDGTLAGLVQHGEIRGLTSNPSIFHNAIANSHDYDAALSPMAWAGYTAEQIYEHLAVEDIRAAADLLRPVFDDSGGDDGYVSLEVSPELADHGEKTFREAKRLFQLLACPNLMVKIPATQAGLPAIRRAIAAGINVNVTLIFSLERYGEVMEAYLSGLEDRLADGNAINNISSVASFFVSRMDSKVDKYLEAVIKREGEQAKNAVMLLGKSAVANTRLAYQEFRKVFEGERFARLKSHGGRLQRPLWASTSTKNPAYPDTLYVDALIGAHTVNTVPPQTLDAFRDHGVVRLTIEADLANARDVFTRLESLGISVSQVTRELEEEGVQAFARAYAAMLATIEERRKAAVAELGTLSQPVAARVAQLEQTSVIQRMHSMDATLWTDDTQGQAEVRQRLGWLTLPETSRSMLPELAKFADEVRQAGYTHALVLGMGGSSLAPEVLSRIFGVQAGGLALTILDSTDPIQVLTAAHRSPARRTLYIVSSKSGGTAEVNAFLDYFWRRTQRAVGMGKAAEHFIAITDPGTSLETLARKRGFRRIFLADATVGGRYSALTAFGLVPAALLGLSPERLLESAARMMRQCAPDKPAGRNPSLVLGAVMGEAARSGRDKLTLIADTKLAPFGAWLEQLIAESSGKQGVGIIPVDGEPLAHAGLYQSDRLFIYLRRSGDHDRRAAQLKKAGHPLLTFQVSQDDDFGAEFYRWELATAVACVVLGVNAFDQADVQDSKNRTKAKIVDFLANGKFTEDEPSWKSPSLCIYSSSVKRESSLQEVIQGFLGKAKAGDYVAINAYLPRERETQALLRRLRVAILKHTRLTTTLGFGPRFLHSTGQLHKGGADNCLILQITADSASDIAIPGQGLTFGSLIRGQALGDLEALQARGRRVLRAHLSSLAGITDLIECIEK